MKKKNNNLVILIFSVLEIYFVILVYSYYQELDEEIIPIESHEQVFNKNEPHKPIDDANVIIFFKLNFYDKILMEFKLFSDDS